MKSVFLSGALKNSLISIALSGCLSLSATAADTPVPDAETIKNEKHYRSMSCGYSLKCFSVLNHPMWNRWMMRNY